MVHLALELLGTSEKEEGHVPFPSVVASSSFLHSFISYLLPLLEVFLNLALLATRLCLFLPQHLSTCLSANPTSRSHPTPPSSVMRRWMVFCHSPGSSEGRCSVWGKCQSLTGGGGGREAGWKMSSFTGKSCEPRNVSSSSNPPSPSPPFFLPSLSVGAQWGCGGRKRGGRSYSADFQPCKKRWPLPVRRSRHKIKGGKLEWEESKRRGNEGKH